MTVKGAECGINHDTHKFCSRRDISRLYTICICIRVLVKWYQCLERRIGDRQLLKSEIAAWEQQRNTEQASVNWRFQTTLSIAI